jgi:hypothetical protein
VAQHNPMKVDRNLEADLHIDLCTVYIGYSGQSRP